MVDGVSIDQSFDLFEATDEISNVDEINFVRGQDVDMADGKRMSGPVDMESGTALITGIDGRTEEERPMAGKQERIHVG